MKSKAAHENYLLLDHRDSPGVPDDAMQRMSPGLPSGAGHGKFEAAAYTCSHCQRGILVNPAPMRAREVPYCRSCDHYICSQCKLILTLTGICRPFVKVMAEFYERAAKGGPPLIFTRNPHG